MVLAREQRRTRRRRPTYPQRIYVWLLLPSSPGTSYLPSDIASGISAQQPGQMRNLGGTDILHYLGVIMDEAKVLPTGSNRFGHI